MGTKNVPLSEVQRAQTVVRHKEGYSERAISQKIKKSKNAVHNAIVKFRNTGTYSTNQKSGRPPENPPTDDQAIRRIAVRSPTSSFKKIRSALLSKGTDISRRTISSCCYNQNFKSWSYTFGHDCNSLS